MLSRRRSLICLLTLGPVLLGGCQALRGPEPVGQTFVSPPGPVVSGGAVRAVPPAQPQYTQPQYQQPAYVPGSPPQYTPGVPPYSPGAQVGGQSQYAPGGQSQYTPAPPAPYLPPAPNTPGGPLDSQGRPAPIAAQVSLRITGPTQAVVGATAAYRFDVANGTATAARNVVITCHLPNGWTYVGSNVAGAVSGQQAQWRLGDVPAYRTMAINASFRPEALGVANLCADLGTAAGALTRSCATTSVEAATPGLPKTDLTPSTPTPSASPLDVAISGPERAAPGENVTYKVTITNRGSTRATKLLVTDEFSVGFVHEKAASPIEKDLDDLDPGQNAKFEITFHVTRPGRHCHTVEVTGAGGLKATAQACLVAAGSPKLVVRQAVTPTGTTVGGTVRFAIDIENKGDVDLTGLVVSSNFDRALRPTQATEVRGRRALTNLKDERYELTPYRFDRLEPGRSIQLDVECKAERASASACGRVTVTAQEGAREEALTCLKIEGGRGAGAGGDGAGAGGDGAGAGGDGAGPGRDGAGAAGPGRAGAEGEKPSPLTLDVSSSGDPVKVGDEVAYLVTVANPGSRTVAGLVLQITMPRGMSQPRAVDANPSRSRLDGQMIVFDPLTLRAGEEAKFRVRAKALDAGSAAVEVAAAAEHEGRRLIRKGHVRQ